MRRIRILLVDMPRMLGDIVTSIVSGQPDMEVVGDLPYPAELHAVVRDTRADVVMLGLREPELPDGCVGLLETFPWVRVLGVAADGRSAFLYELRPQRQSLGEVSPHELVHVIRAKGARVAP